MGVKLIIGNWVEKTAREETICPGYYAADWERHQIQPGKYELALTFERGYSIPMPYWLLSSVKTYLLEGATYSGFGGVNFASRKVEPGVSSIHIQMYAYQLPQLIEAGKVELNPGMEWVKNIRAELGEFGKQENPDWSKWIYTWEFVREKGAK